MLHHLKEHILARRISIFLLLLLPFAGLAQRFSVYQNREFTCYLENFAINDSAAAAYLTTGLIDYEKIAALEIELYPRKARNNYLARKFRRESFIQIKAKDFYAKLDPVFDFTGGMDLQDSSSETLFTNSRGLWVRGNIGKQFAFESYFLENQSTFPNYLDAFADTFTVIPGQGRWKKFKINGYDYAASSGKITYAPFRFLTLQAGHGKPFVGKGYRSLLLSDNSFNYPYLQLHFHSKKWAYSIIYASLQVVDKVRIYTSKLNEPLFKKKSATFQMLRYSPHEKISIQLFQGTIFRVRDSLHPYFDLNVINPVIFSSALQHGLSSSPNVLLGADIQANLSNNFQVYGQYLLDDFSGNTGSIHNKTGVQLGLRYAHVAGIKNLFFQAEYNRVRPYSYTHKRPEVSYTHYGQSLTHPLGANFNEWMGFINYRWKDFFVQVKLSYAQYGADSLGKSYGKNVFASDNKAQTGISANNATFLQGIKTDLSFGDLKISYLINPASNLIVFVQGIQRKESSPLTERNNTLVYFGIKTSLFHNYYDF